ncbi:histone acetyltransferase [Podila horticola]|nr:histone acetyltransferase [Podila horticola]
MSEATTPPPASASPQDTDITLDQTPEEHHHIDYKPNEADSETSEHVVPQQQSANDSEDPPPQQFSPEDKVMNEADPETTDINGSTGTSNTDDTNQSHTEPTSGSTTQTNTPIIAATSTIPNGASMLVYPPADKPLEELPMNERMVKVGRSCPCEEIDAGVTCDCQGWKPSAGTPGLSDTCACGHRLSSHGGPWFGEEFDRRLKAAFRRDELLQDKGKLLDFEYTDEDILSLRKQIVPRQDFSESVEIPSPSHIGSDIAEKHSRQSSMDLMDKDIAVKEEQIDDSEEPNAKRIRLESNGDSHGTEIPNGEANGEGGLTNAEDREQSPAQSTTEPLDEEEEVPVKKEKPAVIEEREGLIEFRVISNDGSRESMILLTGMKNIFQKQLPKMPREYIARLVYDRNHYSMAIVKAPLIVLGGITYRPFNHRKFAEIVFCAITSSEQVKGYGSHLMNHLKDYISEYTQVRHFLTYADNYAIGYFKKQGFTKDITLDRSIWMGYIKDYEGGTIMQCTTVPRVKYLDVNNLLSTQRKAVVTKIKEVTRSHIIYPGLQDFKNGATEVEPLSVPGIQESGWDPLMDTTPRVPKHGPYYNAMKHIVSELTKDASSWPFLTPVDIEAVTDYYSYIKDPMDLATLESNVDADVYKTLDEFAVDCKKIFDNCRIYNGEGTPYVKCANKLEKVFKDKLKEWKEA